MNTDHSDTVNVIKKALETAKFPMTGAALGALINKSTDAAGTPRFKTVSDTLTDFVALYLNDVTCRSDRPSGVDWWYDGVGQETEDRANSEQASGIVNGTLWRTFVSVAASRKLLWHRASMKLGLRDSSQAVPEDAIEIPHTTIEDHKAIFSDFLATQDASLVTDLRSLGATYVDQQYETIANGIKTAGLSVEWGKYRRTALEKLFASRFNSVVSPAEGNEDGAFNSAWAQIKEDRDSRDAAKRSMPKSATPKSASPAARDNNDASRLKTVEIAVDAIRQMDVADIDRLWLPLGAVLKAIQRAR